MKLYHRNMFTGEETILIEIIENDTSEYGYGYSEPGLDWFIELVNNYYKYKRDDILCSISKFKNDIENMSTGIMIDSVVNRSALGDNIKSIMYRLETDISPYGVYFKD